MKTTNIAIDGPASSGKSTVAKRLAHKLGMTYLDTGAMYRSATFLAHENGISYEDGKGIVALLSQFPISFGMDAKEGHQLVFAGDIEITHAIRDNVVTANVSTVAALPEVRQALVDQQRQIASLQDVIMDGRDIGTVVLPDAALKIFLVASVDERAARRYKENQARGISCTLEQLKKDIADRDYKDSHRKLSPLKPAADAITIDTTGMSIDKVVGTIEKKAKEVLTDKQ